MRTAITIGFDSSGKSSLISGPELPLGDQREQFQKYSAGGMPKGIVRVEYWAKGALAPKVAGLKQVPQAPVPTKQPEKPKQPSFPPLTPDHDPYAKGKTEEL